MSSTCTPVTVNGPSTAFCTASAISAFSLARSWIVDWAVNWPMTIFECFRTFGVTSRRTAPSAPPNSA